jgi:hypothetical protein
MHFLCIFCGNRGTGERGKSGGASSSLREPLSSRKQHSLRYDNFETATATFGSALRRERIDWIMKAGVRVSLL